MKKVIVITQNEPLYLYENIERLLLEVDPKVHFSKFYILRPREYGKNMSQISRFLKTIRVFGLRFVFNYIIRRLFRKLVGKDDLKKLLKKHSISYELVTGDINSEMNVASVRKLDAKICVSILGSQIFKSDIIKAVPVFLNLHSSLLPKHRGMLPSFWSILKQDEEVGVSVFQVDVGIDTGPIVLQKRIKNNFKSQADFIRVTKNLGISAIIEVLNSDTLSFKDQSNYEISYNSMPERSDVLRFYKLGKRFF